MTLAGAALIAAAVGALAPPEARAAFMPPVFVVAGSVGEQSLGAPSDFYVARSDKDGNYYPSGTNPQAYYVGLPSASFGLTIGLDKNMYATAYNANSVVKITESPSGQSVTTFVASGTGSLVSPLYLNFNAGNGDLYVTSDAQRRIMRYNSAGASNPSPGHAGTAFFSDVVTTLDGGVTTIPGAQPVGVVMSRDGSKVIAAYEANNAAQGFIAAHDPITGAITQSLTLGVNGWDVVPLPTGDYLVSTRANNILKVNSTLTSFSTLIPAGQGGMSAPFGMELGPDGLLYVADRSGLRVLRFDPITGANMPAPGRTGAFHTQNYAVPGGFDFPNDVVLPEPTSAVAMIVVAGALLTPRRRSR